MVEFCYRIGDYMNGNINNADNNKIDNKKKLIYLSIGVVILILMVVGATYAFYTMSINVTRGNYNTVTTCFDIDYSYANDDTVVEDGVDNESITGTLFPSNNPVDGLTGRVSLKIKDECAVEGIGDLKLNVSDVSDVLVQIVEPHCENKNTLETLTNYTSQNECNKRPDTVWVTNGTALKYAVYDTNNIVVGTTLPLSVGYINSTGSFLLYDDFEMLKIYKDESINYTYYVYIWLDGDVSDNSYTSLVFDGYINATVEQVETYSFAVDE